MPRVKGCYSLIVFSDLGYASNVEIKQDLIKVGGQIDP